MEIQKLLVDPAREQAGVWVEYDETTKFRIGSINSRRYKQTYQEELDALRRKTRKPTDEQADALQIAVYSNAVVLAWEGVTNEGKPFECNPTNVSYVLKNCPQVREFVIATAANYENFRVEKVEEAKEQLGEASAIVSAIPPKT